MPRARETELPTGGAAEDDEVQRGTHGWKVVEVPQRGARPGEVRRVDVPDVVELREVHADTEHVGCANWIALSPRASDPV